MPDSLNPEPPVNERGSGPPLKGPYDPDRIRERVAVAGMTPPDRAPEPLSAEEEADLRSRTVSVLWKRTWATLDAARDSRPVPEQREEPLRVALNAWLNGTGDHVEDEERLVVAAREWLDAGPRSEEGLLREALRAYFKAADDIRDAGEAIHGDPGLIAAMYRSAGKRRAEAEVILRSALRTTEETSRE